MIDIREYTTVPKNFDFERLIKENQSTMTFLNELIVEARRFTKS